MVDSCSCSAQGPQAQWWPHGTATCVLGLVKQMMHVVSPPSVDSGTSGRPVSKLALANETAAGGREQLADGGALHVTFELCPPAVALVRAARLTGEDAD